MVCAAERAHWQAQRAWCFGAPGQRGAGRSLHGWAQNGNSRLDLRLGKGIKLDAVGRQFEPYPYRRRRLHAGGALVV